LLLWQERFFPVLSKLLKPTFFECRPAALSPFRPFQMPTPYPFTLSLFTLSSFRLTFSPLRPFTLSPSHP
jgi:hypothetical protein